MMKFILATVIAFGLVACGDYSTGDTTGDTYVGDNYNGDYTYVEGGIDYGTGTILFCDDANCSVTAADKSITGNSELDGTGSGSAKVGVYNPNYSQAECTAAGFFYCTISDSCLNQRVDDASSGCGK